MVGKKLLKIEECYFNLPNDFNGTLGEALTLLAKYRLEKEKENKVTDNANDDEFDCYSALMSNDNAKCTIEYALCKLSDDETQWETL